VAIHGFLRGEGPDGVGRLFDDVLAFDDSTLERRHDFIQWLFPLREPSGAVSGSPVLSASDVQALREDPLVVSNLRMAAARMAEFYARSAHWLRPADHNHLRITRIVRSLRLLVDDDDADAFMQLILELVRASGAAINPTALRYWGQA
jgi:hypothetical protein